MNHMQRKNIPAYVLANGISKMGFEKLLADIKNAALQDGVDKFNDYAEMIDFIKNNVADETVDQWINDFEVQIVESTKIIKDNVVKIEDLFNKIFEDWEKYKEENGLVEEVIDDTERDTTKSEEEDLVKKGNSKKSKKKKSEVAEGDSDE